MIHRPRIEVQLLVHRPLRFVLAHSTARMQCVAISAACGQKVVPQDGPSTSRFHLLGAWGCGQKHQETLFEYSFVVASRFILMDEAWWVFTNCVWLKSKFFICISYQHVGNISIFPQSFGGFGMFAPFPRPSTPWCRNPCPDPVPHGSSGPMDNPGIQEHRWAVRVWGRWCVHPAAHHWDTWNGPNPAEIRQNMRLT